MPHILTAAIAGTGFIGPVHAEALLRLGIRVKGILGSSPEKSERARQALHLPTSYPDYARILADPEISVVHLAVPNVLHYEMAKQALEAGKHVMCEKPLAMDSGQTAELVELARSRGLHAGVCYNVRFYPLNLQARHLARSGELGRLLAVQGSYVQDWLLHETDYNWRVLADQGGALRAVADIGTHWMDLLTSLTGLEVEAVFADLHRVHDQRQRPKGEVETFSGDTGATAREAIDIDTEDAGSVLFRFKGGAKGALWVSQVTAGRKNRLSYEISGARQALAWDSERPNELWIGQRGGPSGLLPKDPSLLDASVAPFANYPGGHQEGFPDTFKQCFRAFYGAIAEGSPGPGMPYPTFADGHHEVQLCEAILRSHREERWIAMGD